MIKRLKMIDYDWCDSSTVMPTVVADGFDFQTPRDTRMT